MKENIAKLNRFKEDVEDIEVLHKDFLDLEPRLAKPFHDLVDEIRRLWKQVGEGQPKTDAQK